MDTRKYQFLEAVVGHDGARALAKASEHAVELDHAIFPRTILAWLAVASRFGHDGTVPGIEDVKLSFKKSERGFDGYVTLDGALHRFEGASVDHLAGCVAVALGLDHERVAESASPQKIAKLGKSIDLLVKSRMVLKLGKDEKDDQKKKINLPGVAAQPRGPLGPVPPTAIQPKGKQAPAGAAGTSVTPPMQLPKLPKKKPAAVITKSEAASRCKMCGRSAFGGNRYVGCFCFSSLAKNVKTLPLDGGFVLEFTGLDDEEITTLLEGLRGK